jgi:hypothetical protein
VTNEEMIASWKTEIEQINQALNTFYENGAVTEHRVGSRMVRRDQMPLLLQRKRELENLLSMETLGTTRAYASWPKR